VKKSHTGKCKSCDAGQTPIIPISPKSATESSTTPTDSDSAPSITTRSLEIVEWRDANFQLSDEEWDGDYICATVGWTQEEEEWLKITSEVTPNGERAVTRVPLVNVVNRKPLVIVNSLSNWTTSPSPTE